MSIHKKKQISERQLAILESEMQKQEATGTVLFASGPAKKLLKL